MLSRRHLLKSLSLTLPAFATRGLPIAQTHLSSAAQAGHLRLTDGPPLAIILTDFMGLGYEESSVAIPGLLRATNTTYVQLLRNLGTGVLRAGGIVADFTSYTPAGKPQHDPKNTVINRENLESLRGFLDACDWTTIWSVNFGRGTLDEAIAETKDVFGILGPRLLAIELGNEVENYGRGSSPLRPASYGYNEYRAEYSRWRKAILEQVPSVSFAAPDTAASVEWVQRMAADANGEVQLLTTHYYRGDQRNATRDQLLQTDPDLVQKLALLHRASCASGIPWRMCEINSFFGGGRPGLSDTLAGALWTLDTMLLLARSGCAGVNIETGFNQLGFLSSYSPVRNDEKGTANVGVPYYGLLAFALATADAPEILSSALDTGEDNVNVNAYVLGKAGRPHSIVVINKSSDRDLRISLKNFPLRQGVAFRLTGPSLDSREGVTLGNATVEIGGHWRPRRTETVHEEVFVPAGSAIYIKAETSSKHRSRADHAP